MGQIIPSSLLLLLFWASAGVIALVIVVLILRWLLGVNEILNRLQAIRDEVHVIRAQQVPARPFSATRSDVPEPELSHLDMPIPDDWQLGRHDK
ncbi:MAG: hypothetical protein ACREKR_01765 [Candidatus Methylomirabilales bacterium]